MRTLFAVTRVRGPAWDNDKDMRSQSRWDDHAVFMDDLAASGFIVLGGPLGDDGEVLLIIDASDAETIHNKFAADPWSQMGLLEIKEIKRWTILLQSPTM